MLLYPKRMVLKPDAALNIIIYPHHPDFINISNHIPLTHFYHIIHTTNTFKLCQYTAHTSCKNIKNPEDPSTPIATNQSPEPEKKHSTTSNSSLNKSNKTPPPSDKLPLNTQSAPAAKGEETLASSRKDKCKNPSSRPPSSSNQEKSVESSKPTAAITSSCASNE